MRKTDREVNIQKPSKKIYYTPPLKKERPISNAYPVIDTDLGRDNIENDLPFSELQDL